MILISLFHLIDKFPEIIDEVNHSNEELACVIFLDFSNSLVTLKVVHDLGDEQERLALNLFRKVFDKHYFGILIMVLLTVQFLRLCQLIIH